MIPSDDQHILENREFRPALSDDAMCHAYYGPWSIQTDTDGNSANVWSGTFPIYNIVTVLILHCVY